jgi:hypothetical protein
VRDGVNIARYALKLQKESGQPDRTVLHYSILAVIGEEGLRYSARR